MSVSTGEATENASPTRTRRLLRWHHRRRPGGLPGLRLRPGSATYLPSNVSANFMPPPAPSVIQCAHLRAEFYDPQASMTAAVGSFVFPQGGRIVLPIVAFVVLVSAGGVDTEALVITGISPVLVALIAVLVWLIGRSESSARWVGRQLGRLVSWVMVKDELGLAAIFTAFAVAFFAGTVIPITGSGLGVVDVVMVSALSASTSADVNVVVAAVVLSRVLYSIIALFPVGLTLTQSARTHSELLRDASRGLGTEDDERLSGA